ncbi:hypothetical protein [Pseudomonas sp. LB3P14]
MNTPPIVIFVIVALITIAIAVAFLWNQHPVAASFTALTSTLAAMVAGLTMLNIELEAKIISIEVLGIKFDDAHFAVTGTPAWVWVIAFLSTAALLAYFARLLMAERISKQKLRPPED